MPEKVEFRLNKPCTIRHQAEWEKDVFSQTAIDWPPCSICFVAKHLQYRHRVMIFSA